MECLKLNQPCGGAVVSTSQWCPTFITVASIVSQLICWICDICDNTLAAVASSSLDMVHTFFLAVSSRLNNRIGKVNTTLTVNYMSIFRALIKKIGLREHTNIL